MIALWMAMPFGRLDCFCRIPFYNRVSSQKLLHLVILPASHQHADVSIYLKAPQPHSYYGCGIVFFFTSFIPIYLQRARVVLAPFQCYQEHLYRYFHTATLTTSGVMYTDMLYGDCT